MELSKDNKIALFGRSFSALAESNKALISLIYPFKYPFTNIPVLPRKLSDMLMSPVPFLGEEVEEAVAVVITFMVVVETVLEKK